MTSEERVFIEKISNNIAILERIITERNSAIRAMREEVRSLKEKLKEEESRNAHLTSQLQAKSMATSLLNGGDLEVKRKLAEMIREVDECLKLIEKR